MKNLILENRTAKEFTYTTNVYFNPAKIEGLDIMKKIVSYCFDNNIKVICNNKPDGLGTSNMVLYNFVLDIPEEFQHLVSNRIINSRSRMPDSKSDFEVYVENKINELENIYINARINFLD